MLDLAFMILLILWSAGVGLRWLRLLGQSPDHPADALALAVPLGLGTLALSALGLGEIGWLTVPGLMGPLALGAWLGARLLWEQMKAWPQTPSPHRSLIDWIFDGALGLTLLGTLLTALAPVTDGDALCYHLQVPKVFLERHAVWFDPDLHETVYPLVTEMLYAVALALRGPVACRLMQWVLGVAFAANVTALARPVLGARARWAGTLALLVPAVSNGMGAPLNDVALAAFGNAAIVAALRWFDRPALRSAALAGILAGLAIGVKYPALVLVGLLAMAMAGKATSIGRSAWQHVLVFCGVTILIGGCWYLRTFLYTGNPVYPFFRHTFGGAGLDAVLDPARKVMPITAANLLTALATMSLHPDRFDSFSHQLGPAFLLFLPAIVLVRPPRRVLAIVGVGLLFFTLCITQRQSMRFVLIAIGPMAVGVAYLIQEWVKHRSVSAKAILALIVLMMGFETALAVARARHGLSVLLGRESAQAYLSRREPTYRVGRWVASHLPDNTRLIGQDHRGYYFPRPYTMELAHRRRTGLATHGETGEVIVRSLRDDGFTHLLLCPPVPETAVEFDPTLSNRLRDWLAEREPLYRAEITDGDGVLRRYAIYALSDEAKEHDRLTSSSNFASTRR